jgi:hypothetical protein
MVLVKPATVIQWHRQGFHLFWRWRSRSGRPSLDGETRDLIRQMNAANPLWGAPRIHGELLKLGIEICQATVAKFIQCNSHCLYSHLRVGVWRVARYASAAIFIAWAWVG